MKRIAVLTALACSAIAGAQEEMGLDLSEPEIPAEFRPTIGFIGITPAEQDEVLIARSRLLEAELLKILGGNQSFKSVKSPAEAGRAGGSPEAARACTDFQCLEGLAEKMEVHRLIGGKLSKSGPASLLTIYGFDGTLQAIIGQQIESSEKEEKKLIGGFAGIAGKSQSQRDKEFVKKATPTFIEVLQKLSTPLGKIAIDVIDTNAVTTIKGKEIGTGSFEMVLPATSYDLVTTTTDYLPFETTAKVESLKSVPVRVLLVAKPVNGVPLAAKKTDDGRPSAFKRPGLYIAIAGAILAGVGVAMGQMAKGTESRSKQLNEAGVSPVTRAEAQGARTQALLSNIFVGVGAGAFVGGLLWFFLTPTAAPPAAAPPVDGESAGAGYGFIAGMGGTF